MSDFAFMDLLKGITYKPDWSFILQSTKGDWATICMEVPNQTDSNDWSEWVTFKYEPDICLRQTPDQIVNDIRYHLRVMDDHERDEFLLIDGVKRFDPHAK